jgi:hypothetical protein
MKALAAGMLMLGLGACSRAEPDATPEGAVRAWLDAMEDSLVTPKAQREAFELLSQASKRNLQDRAARDAPRLGRRIAPNEMLAEGRFGLRWRPKSFRTLLAGARANVEVRGEPGEEAVVLVSKESEGWRIELELPEVIPLAKRSDAGL